MLASTAHIREAKPRWGVAICGAICWLGCSIERLDLQTSRSAATTADDPISGPLERVNVADDGTPAEPDPGGGPPITSEWPTISRFGNLVAFSSSAGNLEPGDTTTATFDVFVRDRTAGTTERLSTPCDECWASEPSIDAEGRYVAYTSTDPSEFVAGSVLPQVLRHDRQTGEKHVPLAVSWAPDGLSASPNVSDQLGSVAFTSRATNIAVWPLLGPLPDDNDAPDVFLNGLRVSDTGVQPTFPIVGDGASVTPSFSFGNPESPIGMTYAFASTATNLVEDDDNGSSDVFTGHPGQRPVRISVSDEGEEANGPSWSPDAAAPYVAFVSSASNLVPGDSNGASDVFVAHHHSGLDRVSINSDGLQANGPSWAPSVSDDGRFVAFISNASNLAAGAVHGAYVHDRETGLTALVSRGIDGLPANGTIDRLQISGDGRHVAFSTDSDNLVEDDINGAVDIFVRDIENWRPLARATVPNIVPCDGALTRVQLSGALSDDADGDALTHTWDVRQTAPKTHRPIRLRGEVASVCLPPGVYSVGLTVRDGDGAFDDDSAYLVVYGESCDAPNPDCER